MKKFVAMLMVLLVCVSVCTYAEDTWTCPNCGTENTASFCGMCGTQKSDPNWICPTCGSTVDAPFCPRCGEAKPEDNREKGPGGEEQLPCSYAVGDTVIFGTYADEPIEWQVIEVRNDGTCVLLSVKALDVKQYNKAQKAVTWETCSLRAWLNSEFYEKAFSTDEKEKIVLSTVENPDNKQYATVGCDATQDYIYLLSIDEAIELCDSNNRICYPTAYAKRNGAYTDDTGACWWWLRSPGLYRRYAASVFSFGSVSRQGDFVSTKHGCVRPVVCVWL